MTHSFSQFEQRKHDHIQLAMMQSNQATEMNALDEVLLHHEALPDLDFSEISIASTRFGVAVATPFLVSSMTAGHEKGAAINLALANACKTQHWAMGVGSQRRELSDPDAANEWLAIRKQHPSLQLFGNVGIAQIISTPAVHIQRLVDSLQASAFTVHCNPLQEVIQPEGTPHFKGCWEALEKLVNTLSVPVIVKETGCGFSKSTLKRLEDMGVHAVDVSGLGGTHWGRIEGHRAKHLPRNLRAANVFKNWGISTVQSLLCAVELQPSYEIWGSGGVRHGLDAARLIALGAQTIGFAKPMLEAALSGSERVMELMSAIEYELKVAMFCTGSANLEALKGKACL